MILPPRVRRSVVEPLWAAATGTPRLEEWRELERSQYWPQAKLQRLQAERLQALCIAAARDTAFYGRRFDEAGVSPDTIQTPDDLRRVPILTKRDVRTFGNEIMSRTVPRSMLMEFRTGGSTGQPLILYATEDVSERRNASARRSDRWSGWEVGEPVAAVWGNPKLPSTLKERLRHELLEPIIYLDTMALTASSVERFAREWVHVRPTMLFGHAHSIYLLACCLRDQGIDSVRPRAIISTSMMLLASERHVIEEVFGIKATDRYGCEEVGLIGCECEQHAGMHVNIDHVIVEILRDDQTPAAAGEIGNIVVTDLLNYAMPFIRYKVEDLSTLLPERCRCGRELPLMGRVEGRVADFLIRQDGVRVAGVSLIENTLTKLPGIAQMQIVQESLDVISLRIVPELSFDSTVRSALTDYFADMFPGARIEVNLLETIPREPNGKYRFAHCKVPWPSDATSDAEARAAR